MISLFLCHAAKVKDELLLFGLPQERPQERSSTQMKYFDCTSSSAEVASAGMRLYSPAGIASPPSYSQCAFLDIITFSTPRGQCCLSMTWVKTTVAVICKDVAGFHLPLWLPFSVGVRENSPQQEDVGRGAVPPHWGEMWKQTWEREWWANYMRIENVYPVLASCVPKIAWDKR